MLVTLTVVGAMCFISGVIFGAVLIALMGIASRDKREDE